MIKKEKVDSYKQRAAELVSKMTLNEKVYQLRHTAPAIERLGVPAYNYWNEALHGVARAGVATVFPQAIGMAASFDEELVGEVAKTISTEGRGKFNAQFKYGDTGIYKGLTFWSPNVNIFRDPRWGRGHETYGEDPYLTSRLGVSFVKGLQGDDDTYLKAAACAKHFAVHSGPEAIRHSFDAKATTQDMRETYLPAFQALVQEADVEAVMGAYNRTNGEPCCGSKTLLQDILREEWGFDGHVTSDCWAIQDFHMHHLVTETPEESVAMAMNAGCDLNCGNIYQYLEGAVAQGLVKEEVIDRALTRCLTTRMKLGLFDPAEGNPYADIDYSCVDTKEARALNLKAALETITLLKNDGTLPLKKDAIKTIGIIGPNADNRKALVGNYEGTSSEYITVLDGIRHEVADTDIRIFAAQGCHLYKDRCEGLGEHNDRIAEVRAVCEQSDVIICCLGLDASLEGEEGDTGNEYGSGDKPNLNLPGLQQEVLEECAKFGKPVILVLLSGSALAVTWAQEHVNGILEAWYPGAQGGRAVAELLFGKSSPCGKLPVTFYNDTNDLPAFEDYSMAGRTYRYLTKKPLYPFGYGLSYASFTEEVGNVSADTISADGTVEFDVTVKNTGAMDAAATIQVYVKADLAGAPNMQLKGLKKVAVKAGDSTVVRMTLTADAFALFDEEGRKMLNAGTYTVFAADGQPDERTIELTGMKPASFTVKVAETTEIK